MDDFCGDTTSKGRRSSSRLWRLSVLSVQPFAADRLHLAGRMVRKYADHGLTLADAHGLVIMQQRRIAECWSTDRHLGLAGAPLVI